tara:strand:- start:3487 stop:4290 length:804 start_codon:yes stop_codon:yes gene_type:complete
MADNKDFKVSIAIPTYNSSKYLSSCINSLKNSELINEVIIHDDHSDEDEYEKIVNIVNKFKNTLNIKIYRNSKNIGAFKNKFDNIQKCKNEIIYQIDSDNIASPNLDKVFNFVNEENNPSFLYIPSRIYQFRKYPKSAKIFSTLNNKYKVTYTNDDFIFDKNIFYKAISKDKKFTVNKNINWILNSGNFITHKKSYINTFKKEIKTDTRYPMDAVAISFFWIKNGGKIKTLRDLKHFHRKRQDSVSFIENDGSYESLQYFRNKFLEI